MYLAHEKGNLGKPLSLGASVEFFHGLAVIVGYIEDESGAKLDRPALERLVHPLLQPSLAPITNFRSAPAVTQASAGDESCTA